MPTQCSQAERTGRVVGQVEAAFQRIGRVSGILQTSEGRALQACNLTCIRRLFRERLPGPHRFSSGDEVMLIPDQP